MTRVLVLGGSGMLGHKLTQVLGDRFETWATVRQVTPAAESVLATDRIVPGVHAGDLDGLARAIEDTHADVVVNAIGIMASPR